MFILVHCFKLSEAASTLYTNDWLYLAKKWPLSMLKYIKWENIFSLWSPESLCKLICHYQCCHLLIVYCDSCFVSFMCCSEDHCPYNNSTWCCWRGNEHYGGGTALVIVILHFSLVNLSDVQAIRVVHESWISVILNLCSTSFYSSA